MPKFDRLEHEGIKFLARPDTSDVKAFNEVIVRRGYRRRDFEPAAGQHWIDLGANVGAFTVWAGMLGARVTAYEPDPDSYDMIMRNLRANGLHREDRIRVRQKAVVMDDRTEVTLHRNDARGNVWRNSIERTWRGGSDVTVPAVNIRKIWKPSRFVKMDIEGTEMPILEGVGSEIAVQGLVFEWSFDVDPSLDRFRNVITALEALYSRVAVGKIPEGDTWKPEWFPPCRSVWCYA